MSIKNCSDSPDALLSLIEAVKLSYKAPPEQKKRGRKPDFSDLSFLLLAVVAVVTKTYSDSALHRLLSQDKELLSSLEFQRVPHRTRLGKRLKALCEAAEEQIANLGKTILAEVAAPANHSQVSATDGRMYQALGPKWHKKHRLEGVIPAGLRNVDRESKWSKSDYRKWVQGYRLLVQTVVFPEPVPLCAVWRENQLNEAKIVLAELEKGRLQITDVMLADRHFGKADFVPAYQQAGGYLLTPLQLPGKNRTWKNDLYDYRKETIELLFQRIIQAFDLKECPVKGEAKNGALVLAAVWTYQVCWLNNYRRKKNPALVKEQIENARWRLKL